MAKNHFYNLPNAYNPGYADPEYVLEDGLQRRASVTPMTPRGTYDDPKVGSGGYALPNYIGKENYGQGTYTTKWAKRGTFDTPAIPQLGDIDYQSSNVFGTFGARAAARIVGRVMRLPSSQRRAALKAALDKIDPKLFARAERYTNAEIAKGAHPRAALVKGLAKAMSEGMLEELDRAGRTGTAPQANSLPGLGCYGARSALGATPSMTVGLPKGSVSQGGSSSMCAPPAGYTWDVANGAMYLRRLKAGETPKNGPCGGSVSTGGTSGQGTVADSDTKRPGKYIQLGPSADRIWFSIPEQTGRFAVTPLPPGKVGAQSLPAEVWSDIVTQLQKASTMWFRADTVGNISGGDVDGTKYGLPASKYAFNMLEGKLPIYNFTYPGSSTRYGVFIDYLSPGVWEITTRNTEPTDPISRGLSWVKGLFAKIVDVVKDVVEEVADMACELVNNPNAAAAAGQASGPGAAIGVGAAQAACGRGNQAPPPTVLPGGDTGTLVLLGAGALFVAAMVKRKRKKKG